MKLNAWFVVLAGSVATTLAIAKLPAPPAPTDEQKAKVAEAKEKAAEGAKKDASDLGRYQDKSAERFFRDMKAAGKTVPVATWVPPAPVVAATPAPSPSAAPSQKPSVAPTTQESTKASTKSTPAKG